MGVARASKGRNSHLFLLFPTHGDDLPLSASLPLWERERFLSQPVTNDGGDDRIVRPSTPNNTRRREGGQNQSRNKYKAYSHGPPIYLFLSQRGIFVLQEIEVIERLTKLSGK